MVDLKNNGKSFNSYFMILFLLLLGMLILNLFKGREDNYTRAEFLTDMSKGTIKEIIVSPNKESLTGHLTVVFENGSKKLYATDIRELELLVRENGYEPTVEDIERDSWFLTYMLLKLQFVVFVCALVSTILFCLSCVFIIKPSSTSSNR